MSVRIYCLQMLRLWPAGSRWFLGVPNAICCLQWLEIIDTESSSWRKLKVWPIKTRCWQKLRQGSNGWMSMARIHSCIWTLGPQVVNCLGEVGRCGLVGRGMPFAVGFEISKDSCDSRFALSASYLWMEMWALSCSCHHAFAPPPWTLPLWNHKPKFNTF